MVLRAAASTEGQRQAPALNASRHPPLPFMADPVPAYSP
jgi:hypothetical protein